MSNPVDAPVTIDAPPPWLVALEVRAFGERAAMSASLPLLRRLPRGDGHHVIVLPGFTAGDQSTRPLRHLLRDLGYASHGWRLGQNVGPTPRIVDGIAALLDRIHTQAQAPVSLIGWSLGGIYARELARAAPDLVRQVITLGSPIQMIEHDRSSAERIWRSLRHRHAADFRREVRAAYRPRLDVPTTSIYTRTDGVVSFQASLIRRTPTSENIRVYGSHCGLGFNNAAVYAIADRLAQPKGQWRHFSAPLLLKGAFPCADDFDPTRMPHSD
ncbi:MAG: alpha/beta fold hydrolase [Ilumatobacter sp.]|nr:alpha/beta fold hydrolase [Ilumatobacter sp.]